MTQDSRDKLTKERDIELVSKRSEEKVKKRCLRKKSIDGPRESNIKTPVEEHAPYVPSISKNHQAN